MEWYDILSLVLGAANLIVMTVILIKFKRQGASNFDGGIEVLHEAESLLKEEIKNDGKVTRESIAQQFNTQNITLTQLLKQNSDMIDQSFRATERRTEEIFKHISESGLQNEQRFDGLNKRVEERLDKIRDELRQSLTDMRKNNETELEKMRQTVDEKLSKTLNDRFTQSFKLVNDSLDNITRGFGEMQSLTSGMNDLKKVLSNVKNRGSWGEASLDSLLSQILAPEQYKRNVRLKRAENSEAVDFAIVLPGQGKGDSVLLPIDAKFPLEDYQKMIDAADEQTLKTAKNALAVRVRTEAVSIKNKYIVPPKTTDFAIMYLPVEGLFAEVLQIPGLADELQSKHRIVLCGPTTIAALLNSLQMGFRTVAVEKRSSEIYKMLQNFKTQFGQFCDILENTRKKINDAGKQIDMASDRTRKIQKKLDKIESLDDGGQDEKFLTDDIGDTDTDVDADADAAGF